MYENRSKSSAEYGSGLNKAVIAEADHDILGKALKTLDKGQPQTTFHANQYSYS